MALTLAEKIIKAHLINETDATDATEGAMAKGREIGIRIDQTLTQDSTGTMAYLQLEAIGVPRVKTELSVAYIDHNMLQEGFENADDHRFIQTIARKKGIRFSRPGNGICHQVHIERFGRPGATLLGSDSHTPTAGGIGMLGIGAGGLDVACAMAGSPYYISMPAIVNVRLSGKLRNGVSAKDVILEVLRVMTVKGGVGRIIEYSGEGAAALTVPERATITNMGAELGATTSIFPSDAMTRAFLKAQGREDCFIELSADEGAAYDSVIDIDLSRLEPLAAMPHSPDNVKKVSELQGLKPDQVAIGSCTNGSYADLMIAARILEGRTVHPDVSLVISPGSRQALSMLAEAGALKTLVEAGARILESGCGPCIGMGQSPRTGGVSLRTFNRNFKGRSGTESAMVYLVSPQTAALSAVRGELTSPMGIGLDLNIPVPEAFAVNDNMIEIPPDDPSGAVVEKGPNIKDFPLNKRPEGDLRSRVLIKLGDNITTDHIMPSHAKLLPFRSNIPYLASFCLSPCDENFAARARENGGGAIIGGENYGQGSSREHAALAPLQLGVNAVIAKSFARIHKSNLINSGILPLTFNNPEDYDKINLLDELVFEDIPAQIARGGVLTALSGGKAFEFCLDVSDKERKILLAGGKINMIREASIVTKLNINDIIFSNVSTGDIYENEISDNFVGRRTR